MSAGPTPPGPLEDPEARVRATFAYRLHVARITRTFTQAQLAAAVGVRENDVRRWERGENLPRTIKLPALRAALGVSLDHLLPDPLYSPTRSR